MAFLVARERREIEVCDAQTVLLTAKLFGSRGINCLGRQINCLGGNNRSHKLGLKEELFTSPDGQLDRLINACLRLIPPYAPPIYDLLT
jgi:hypothetical protein